MVSFVGGEKDGISSCRTHTPTKMPMLAILLAVQIQPITSNKRVIIRMMMMMIGLGYGRRLDDGWMAHFSPSSEI